MFLVAFGLNLIPFVGPSNMIIAANAGYSLDNGDVTSFLFIGIITALGATLAKSTHYVVTFFISQQLNENKQTSPDQTKSLRHRLQLFISQHLSGKKYTTLNANTTKIKNRAFLSIYLAAATPIPDEPIVITLGLMKYSITKFVGAYFLGKLTIAGIGAFLGNTMSSISAEHISQEMLIVMSIVLTIIMMIILLKVDLGKLFNRLRGKSHLTRA
ncbi:MAG: VTT domain-containing protein [Nitrososphaerota archaeon]|jgi:membrane protein YqaA with SNARE-associated domain|uniref:VTT domain-containing protein n=1 Tax=Candidatus Bathycorpusculum sp. TaxID=2994959 RepID=UPI0028312EC9|nr:VTT domain-containing protein [Candidatus Termiticorpusculum sp.]MCL2257181.1 VTT domain-containing protein [Candidatus Termiticorpusculum sp.]MCL2292684.1 VTT domain-containing protein [Candidatus Termiticorpusculum sp.]MDR0461541.1 VTT domain-containing protein [Nitrososphaerota archaeon]